MQKSIIEIYCLFFVKRSVFILVVVFVQYLYDTAVSAVDNCTASLRADLVNAGICEVIYRVAVTESNSLVVHHHIVEMVVTEEDSLSAAKLKNSVEHLAGILGGENVRVAFADFTEKMLYVIGILFACLKILVVGISYLKQRNVYKEQTLYSFGASERGVVLMELFDLRLVPIST